MYYDTIDQAIEAAELSRETENAFADFESFLFDSTDEPKDEVLNITIGE